MTMGAQKILLQPSSEWLWFKNGSQPLVQHLRKVKQGSRVQVSLQLKVGP